MITLDNVEVLSSVLPSGNYTAIRFTSQNTAYVISGNGKIFKTEDGGDSWTQQNSGTELYLQDMFFWNDLNGYIIGGHADGIILKTIDGGNTWLSTNLRAGLSGIYFINQTTGFIAGNGMFYKTQNGGETWDEVDLGYSNYQKISFFDKNTGLLTAGICETLERVVLKTTDGGNNWVQLNTVSLGLRTIIKIQILNGIAYLASNSGIIFKTPDRGNTWQIINSPASRSVHFINNRQGVGVGQHWYELGYFPNGLLCITNDGGKHWEEKYFPANEFYSISDIDFSNDSTALAVGASPQGSVIKLKFK